MLTELGEKLYQGFLQVAPAASDYFNTWTYNTPLVVSSATNDRLRRVQQRYQQCIRHYIAHYDAYRNLIPLPERVDKILGLCRNVPYRIGTYRTDFVIDESNQIKLIETTCRFALNGYFTTGFLQRIARRYLETQPQVRELDFYTQFFNDFMAHFPPFNRVCLLKGADERNDTRYIVQILKHAGFPVHVIPTDDIPASTHLFSDAAVLGELDHDEILRLPDETIQAIIEARGLNDLRTVFLLHDKRFFALLSTDDFLRDTLPPADRKEFRAFLAPSYTRQMRPDIWAQARGEKDRWILKPYAGGKSIDVHAGCVTDAAEWKAIFDSGRIETMILQAYVRQRKFRGHVRETPHDDYVAGTLLFFNDGYYGPGLFRASSFPVTNTVDDRKIAPLVTADTDYFENDIIL